MTYGRTFSRLTSRILANLGGDALLRGQVTCRVNIEHDVEVLGDHGDIPVAVSVATLAKAHSARKGDTLAMLDAQGVPLAGERYVIDGPPLSDNGFSVRFPLRRV